jgi:dynactin complex subunit
MEKLDIGETVDQSYPSQKDFITRSGGVSGNIHQLCVIITEVAEDNDPADNTTTHAQVNKSRSSSKKEKEKIHVSTGEWRIIMSAINHGIEVPANSRRKVLMGYQYALHQHKKKLREEKYNIRRSQENNSVSSGAYWMNTAKHQTPAERYIESQSIIGGQQRGQGKRTAQEA